MGEFRTPEVILFTTDAERAARFYTGLGFTETFRVPSVGPPIHVDLELDGYRIGFATVASARADHGLDPVEGGQRGTVTLWTDDAVAAYGRLVEAGVPGLKPPHIWLDRLMIHGSKTPTGTRSRSSRR